jgi:hypothetical protein
VTGILHGNDIVVRPPGSFAGRRATAPDGSDTPRTTPLEWARRRRVRRSARRVTAARDRTKNRLSRLGEGWHLIDAARLGSDADEALLAIGPGGVFAVTVVSQGRSKVLVSGDVVQINGRRPDLLGDARRLGDRFSAALSRTAGTFVPVTPVLAFTGTGLISLYGLPRRCLVMPYRELDHLLREYGERIAPRTVAKLASIARHPATSVELQMIEAERPPAVQRRAS